MTTEKRRAQWKAAQAKRRANGLATKSGGSATNAERQRRHRQKLKEQQQKPK